MALYSSTLFLTSGLNVSFINNLAYETGGVVHIEPDMTRDPCPGCFYQIKGHPTDITFYYSDSHAEFGGDNIYGTSLALCEKNLHDITNHFSSNAGLSSVSSDPRQMCLCDSDGQPQCENAYEILTSKSIHPGETITIPAVIVGGDYGTTIGIVHATFVSTTTSTTPAPVFHSTSSYHYSQWIDNSSVCTDLKYIV